MQIQFIHTGWCYLYSLPDLKNGGTLEPGSPAAYGRTAPNQPSVYYVALPLGKRDGSWLVHRDLELSMVYPERVFAWALDQNGKGVTDREVLLEIFTAAGIRGDGFWEPVLIQRGWDKDGPTWHTALRSNTDNGPPWYDIQARVLAMNDGRWQVDTYQNTSQPEISAWVWDKSTIAPPDKQTVLRAAHQRRTKKIRK